MPTFFNPFSWFSKISKTGQFIDPKDDPLTATQAIPQLPVHTMLGADATSLKRQEEKLALLNKFLTVTDTRTQLIYELRKLRKSPIVQMITDAYINEGFYSNNRLAVYDVTYIGKGKKSTIQNRIDDITKKLHLQKVTANLLADLGIIGEYLLTPVIDKENGKGILKLQDNEILEDILPLYEGEIIKNYLKKTYNPAEPVQFLNKESFIHFILPTEPIRIKMEYSREGYLQKYNLPESLKMGKSIFLYAIDMIKRLEMLDAANLALALRQILLPVLLSIGVPAGTTVKDCIELTDYYEEHIEEIFEDIGNVQNITIQSLINISSKIRALPQYSDGKGTLGLLDIGQNKAPNFEQTNAIKREIALITNTPFYFISTDGSEPVDRQTELKNYAKFTKNINVFQHGVKSGLADLYCLDLKYFQKGFHIIPDEIQIDFKQMVNVDQLTMMEFLIGSGTALSEIFNSASAIANDEKSKLAINPEVLLKISNGVFDNIPNAKGLLIKAPEPTPEEQPEQTFGPDGTPTPDNATEEPPEVNPNAFEEPEQTEESLND